MADLTSATLFVIGVWNSVAERTGNAIEEIKDVYEVTVDELGRGLPAWTSVFWGALQWYRFLLARAELVEIALDKVGEILGNWYAEVREIVANAAAGELPMPERLRSQVIRGDVAARYVLQALVAVSVDTTQADRSQAEETILEVAFPSRSTSVDDDPRETLLQRLWRRTVGLLVRWAILIVPLAIAYVAGKWYLQLWGGIEAMPTLAQDSRRERVRIDGQSAQRRVNLKPGPDK